MGADLIIASLIVDADANLDFDAGFAAIARLQPADVEDADYFDVEPAEAAGMREIRRVLAHELDDLRRGLADSREVEWIEVRGAVVYLTGGMSYGDVSTELMGTIDRLRAVRGVLAAVGFEDESE